MNKDYDKQAKDFCNKFSVTITSKKMGHGYHFKNDSDTRDIYEVTIARDGKGLYTFKYGQSIMDSNWSTYSDHMVARLLKPVGKITLHDIEQARMPINSFGKAPSEYDILSIITKYDLGTFDDFCGDFGYSTDSISARDIYIDTQKESQAMLRMFSDCLEELQDIN